MVYRLTNFIKSWSIFQQPINRWILIKIYSRYYIDRVIYFFVRHFVDSMSFNFNIWSGTKTLVKYTYDNKRIFIQTSLNDTIKIKNFNDADKLNIYHSFRFTMYDFIKNHQEYLLLFLKILVILLNHNNDLKIDPVLTRINFRLKQTSLGIYIYLTNFNNVLHFFSLYTIYIWVGLKSLWKHLKLWLLPIVFCGLIVYHGLIVRALPFNKVVFVWLAFFMLLYWLISGFVFFFKKYQYGKYTSAIQRFWRRSYILFWLLESCLLLVFIYLTLVASQESFFMFDQIQIYKTHLFSWRIFFLKIFPLTLLLILAYFFMLMLKWNIFSKHSVWLLLFTVILTYIVWLEFYQYFHIANFYGNLVWTYDIDERLWNLELEARRTRILNHYMMWLLILKFWHLLFVYVFWIFFVLRGWEKLRVRYPLLSANHQNLIILYIMSWLIMLPWFKIYFRKFMDIPYFWFYVNNRSLFIRLLFNDLKILWYGLTQWLIHFKFFSFKYYSNVSFFYWIETNKFLIFNLTKKHFIRNQIIIKLSDYVI